jgi:hypothetical protein
MNVFMLHNCKKLLTALLLGGQLLLCSHIPAATLERPDSNMRQALMDAVNSSDSFKDRFDAEVWMSDMSRRLESRIKDPQERLTIQKSG